MIVEWMLALVLCGSLLTEASEKQRLVVFLVDGMRWDYINRDPELKAFARIAEEGVHVKHVTPIFPSLSYPNWYTIATGLFSENHGIIENHMYDAELNDRFMMGPHPNVSHEHWWNRTEPLWVEAEKNGFRTAVHFWDGCQVKIHGWSSSICESYRTFWMWFTAKNDTMDQLVKTVDWFEESEDNRLEMIYYEGPDDAGHTYGPDAQQTMKAVRDVDQMLKAFQDRLDRSRLKNSVNLMVVSDHGMEDVSSATIIRVDDLGVKDDIHLALGSGALISIFPKLGKTTEVYNKLTEKKVKGLHVYLKEQVPSPYNFGNADLAPPILLLADSGYYLVEPGSPVSGKPWVKGTHGFDPYVGNSQMSTLMLAKGPAFKKGYAGGPLDQTDHYNIYCHILGIEPHANNGSWSRVVDLLANP